MHLKNFVWGRDKRNPIASRYQPHLPLKPTIRPPSIENVNGVPSSIPNGPKVLLLLLNVSDRITGLAPGTIGQQWPLTLTSNSSGYCSLIWNTLKKKIICFCSWESLKLMLYAHQANVLRLENDQIGKYCSFSIICLLDMYT